MPSSFDYRDLVIEDLAENEAAVRDHVAFVEFTEKVPAWADVSGTPPAPSLVEKVALIEQTEPAALLELIQAAFAEPVEVPV